MIASNVNIRFSPSAGSNTVLQHACAFLHLQSLETPDAVRVMADTGECCHSIPVGSAAAGFALEA